MSEVACIGKCIGCDRMRRVKVGVCQSGAICEDCEKSGARGPKWAERAHRCRTDPGYAQGVYDSIETVIGKKLFVAMFGLPAKACPPAPDGPVPTGTCR